MPALSERKMDPQQMMALADALRKRGIPEEQIEAKIDEFFGGDESEMTGPRDIYRSASIPANAALTSDAKNAWGAAGNLVSGIYAGQREKEYKELSEQRKQAALIRRRAAAEIAGRGLEQDMIGAEVGSPEDPTMQRFGILPTEEEEDRLYG